MSTVRACRLAAVAVKTPVFFCKLARMNVLTIGVQPQRWLRGADWLPAPEQLTVVSSPCLGPLEPGEGPFRELSDDQAICIGYANDLEATNHLPPEQ